MKPWLQMEKMDKMPKTFLCLLPICACAVGCGVVYDNSLMGLGLKWGCAVAMALVALFFIVVAGQTLDS